MIDIKVDNNVVEQPSETSDNPAKSGARNKIISITGKRNEKKSKSGTKTTMRSIRSR